MPISLPRLVSCSARIEESVVVRAGNEAYIYAFKNHIGSPRREVEVFTIRDVEDAQDGDLFFNVVPIKIEILDQVFRFNSAIVLTSEQAIANGINPIIRFYWNQGGGRQTGDNPILQIDYDPMTRSPVSPVSILPFRGIDPFIMDARTPTESRRFYMMYIDEEGRQALRVSRDLGVTWSLGCSFDSDVRYVEGIIQDPQGSKELLRAMQLQSVELDIEPLGDVFLNDFSTAPIRAELIQRIYPFTRQRRPKRMSPTGLDLQRFKAITPLVIRVPPTRDPC